VPHAEIVEPASSGYCNGGFAPPAVFSWAISADHAGPAARVLVDLIRDGFRPRSPIACAPGAIEVTRVRTTEADGGIGAEVRPDWSPHTKRRLTVA
jgi:hypothetical protein